ncbi:hypothetical protein V3G39_02005 [Dermatophilaceae bacterium Sec6.4]
MRDRRPAPRVVGVLAALVYRASDAVAGVLLIALAALCRRGLRGLSVRQDSRPAMGWVLIGVSRVCCVSFWSVTP